MTSRHTTVAVVQKLLKTNTNTRLPAWTRQRRPFFFTTTTTIPHVRANPLTTPSVSITTISRNRLPRQLHSRRPTTTQPQAHLPATIRTTPPFSPTTPTTLLTSTFRLLTPTLVMCCHFSHASDLVDKMIIAKEFPKSENGSLRQFKRSFEWDLGSRFLRMPEYLRQRLDDNGFFAQSRYTYLNSELKYRDPYIGDLMRYRRVPFQHAANYMDPYVRYRCRRPGDPDYAMYNDELTGRMMSIDWTDTPVLFEKVLMTRRKSLSQVDREHQLLLIPRAPSAGMGIQLDQYGLPVPLQDPPNGPKRPQRPEMKSPYPWRVGTDFDDLHFQL